MKSLYYEITKAVWKDWPLIPGVVLPQGENHQFITYPIEMCRPDLVLEIKNMGLIYNVIQVFYTAPGKPVPIHIDGLDPVGDNPARRASMAINWTLLPCDPWVMHWYATPEKYIDVSSTYKWLDKDGRETIKPYTYRRYATEDCVKIQEVSYNNPCLVDTSVLHNIVMQETTSLRWCASLRVVNDDFNTIRQKFER